jgi:putative transposase
VAVVLRVYKFRLYPTHAQEAALGTLLGRLRFFYNAALQERRDGYRQGVKVTRATQEKAITVVKHDPDCPDYAGIHTHLLQDVLKRLDLAFDAFFRRIKAGGTPGYPRFKRRGRYETFTLKDAGKGNGAAVVSGGARVRLHGIGNVKIKQHREMEGVLKTLGVTRDGDGHWYALITREVPAKPLPATGVSVGIDVGLTTFAALSDGELVANPRPLKTVRIAVERAQRKVSRRKRGSKRRGKARRLLAGRHAHVRNTRKDFHHKTARAIVQKYDRIAVEDLNVNGLARGMLAQSVHDAGWSQFVAILTSKAEEAGREVKRVDPNGTSQECSACGERVPKALGVRVHRCPCGYTEDRDVNAARNIHDRAFAVTGLGRSLRGGAPARDSGDPRSPYLTVGR